MLHIDLTDFTPYLIVYTARSVYFALEVPEPSDRPVVSRLLLLLRYLAYFPSLKMEVICSIGTHGCLRNML
jgi:hypothetical protein